MAKPETKTAKRFDPVRALKENPPGSAYLKGSVFDNPRIQEWLRAWLTSGQPLGWKWMTDQIREGVELESIDLGGKRITPSNLSRWLEETPNGQKFLKACGGKVRSVKGSRS